MNSTIGKKLGSGFAILCVVIGAIAVLVISESLRMQKATNQRPYI